LAKLSGMAEQTIIEALNTPDPQWDLPLRPSLLSEFIGQTKVKERLAIKIATAKQRRESMDHVLLGGAPGLGKTTLAHILAREMGVNMRCATGHSIQKEGDLAGLLTNLDEGDVLFISEFHHLRKTAVEEHLYPAMEHFQMQITIDEGQKARSVRINLPRFTLIAATTEIGLIRAPELSRFPI